VVGKRKERKKERNLEKKKENKVGDEH